MRGNAKDSIWLFMGVVLLFAIMATFSPGSTMGKAFLSMRRSVEGAFGGEVGYCPFINPYAMSIYSAGELVITGEHPVCAPLIYVVTNATEYDSSATCGSDMYSIKVVNQGDPDFACGEDELSCISVYKGDELQGNYDQDEFFGKLTSIQDNVDKSNSVAIQLLTEKRPMWQCFFIFGLLPFFITYYLINDILTFAYLRTNTRRLIAIFAALLAIITGSFANIIVAVSSFVGLSVGQSFLLAIFSLALLSVFLGQLTVTAGVAQTTVNAVQKAVTGALVLTNLADATGQKGRQNER